MKMATNSIASVILKVIGGLFVVAGLAVGIMAPNMMTGGYIRMPAEATAAIFFLYFFIGLIVGMFYWGLGELVNSSHKTKQMTQAIYELQAMQVPRQQLVPMTPQHTVVNMPPQGYSMPPQASHLTPPPAGYAAPHAPVPPPMRAPASSSYSPTTPPEATSYPPPTPQAATQKLCTKCGGFYDAALPECPGCAGQAEADS